MTTYSEKIKTVLVPGVPWPDPTPPPPKIKKIKVTPVAAKQKRVVVIARETDFFELDYFAEARKQIQDAKKHRTRDSVSGRFTPIK